MWITLWIIVSKLCIDSMHSIGRVARSPVAKRIGCLTRLCVCGLATYEETLVSESDTLWGE